MLTSNKSSAKPPTQPCKMGLINRFLAVSELLILRADGHLYRWTLRTTEAPGPRAACHLHLLHEMAELCLTHAQPVPRRAAAEQWGDAPPFTFHRAPLSHLMNLYSTHWLPGLHQNAASPASQPRIFSLECVIGCEVERGACWSVPARSGDVEGQVPAIRGRCCT